MKKAIKRTISLAMCAVLLFGALGISAFAETADGNEKLPYKCYTYIGDSIPWGYGLNRELDTGNRDNVCVRVDGAYTDIVGKVLEENNGAEVHAAASSGARASEFRSLFEIGMGVAEPYSCTEDWFGSRHPDRTEALLNKADLICGWVSESDLITVQIGINDITAMLVNSLSATGVIDLGKITAISDAESVLEYIQYALNNLREDPMVLDNVIKAFNSEVLTLRRNTAEIVKDVVTLAPEEADILLVGYHNAAQSLRIIPGTDFSIIFEIVNTAIASLNDYYAGLASQYGNVYYVSAPYASCFYPQGTDITDILADTSAVLLGIHPDAAGHEYIAQRVLATLDKINDDGDTHHCQDAGKITTPDGKTVNVPVNTINQTVHAVTHAITSTVTRIFNGIASLFAR